MNAFLMSLAAIVVISFGASFALEQLDYSSAAVYQSENVRLD